MNPKEILMKEIDIPVATIFKRNWLAFLLRGIVAILFGVLAWRMPQISLTALVLLFGLFVFVDGILHIWVALAGRKKYRDWWVLLSSGVLGLSVGVIALFAPAVAAIALVYFMAFWAIATGTLQIVEAIYLRRVIKGEWLHILGGFVSVIFGILLMIQPAVGALAMLWLISAYAFTFGILMVVLAFRARTFGRTTISAHDVVYN